MKKTLFNLFLIAVLLSFCSSAYAANWKRIKGIMTITYLQDNFGNTVDTVPPSSLRIVVNQKLVRQPGLVQSCRDNKALQQRVCNQKFYLEMQAQGSCLYRQKIIYNRFTSTSRKLQVFSETTVTCPGGYAAYYLAEGNLTRS